MFVTGVGVVGAKGNCSFQPSMADKVFVENRQEQIVFSCNWNGQAG
jgi:hypothetical protein